LPGNSTGNGTVTGEIQLELLFLKCLPSGVEPANIVFHRRWFLNMSCQIFMIYKILLFCLQEIGQALLPLPSDAKSQPGPATATPVAATATEAAPAAATPTPLSPYTNVSVNLILYSHCTSEPECPCHAHYSAIGIPCSTQISSRRHPLAAPRLKAQQRSILHL
jgi:hypothetical protein